MRIEFFIMIAFIAVMMIIQKKRSLNKEWERDI